MLENGKEEKFLRLYIAQVFPPCFKIEQEKISLFIKSLLIDIKPLAIIWQTTHGFIIVRLIIIVERIKTEIWTKNYIYETL